MMTFKCLYAVLITWILSAVIMTTGYAQQARRNVSLNGEWLFQRESAKTDKWKTINIPSSFEEHEGDQFDGVGLYKKTLPHIEVSSNKRILLQFDGAATFTEVWFDKKKLGAHLGGWTPFRFDVTDLLCAARPGGAYEIIVRVDEKVGHNTQGFLPIIAPHFGGIWQDVKLIIVPEKYIDDLRVQVIGNPDTGALQIEAPVINVEASSLHAVTVKRRLTGCNDWKTSKHDLRLDDSSILKFSVTVDNAALWSPTAPNLYEVKIQLASRGKLINDEVTFRAAFRKIETSNKKLLLNGKPLGVRGLLNWGYYPPKYAPNPDKSVFRKDLEYAKSRGFNLMKFCLWIPPKRYFELADEMGFLTWMEYPTWHPKLTAKHLADLKQEFREFFYFDRNHPSVILRSLTCETGPGAELAVIQSLYDMAHSMIPGAVVEDDSSWIGWNRVHDFYDDHPYGNNHTWVATLKKLTDHIASHGEKPLVLGEAIAADTWIDISALLNKLGDGRPFFAPRFLDATSKWMDRIIAIAGPHGMDRLMADSKHYAMLMRKYQVETFRREVPFGGYVISVIRDFSLASMGMLDYSDQAKWSSSDWRWHKDIVCIIKTKNDCRSFRSKSLLEAEILISHFGEKDIFKGALTVTLEQSGKVIRSHKIKDMSQKQGSLKKALNLEFRLPSVSEPERFVIRSVLTIEHCVYRNDWPIWIVPAIETNNHEDVKIASKLDEELLDLLEAGGCAIILADGEKHSFPLSKHWFLRGGPYISGHPVINKIPRQMLVELQHFDLAGSVIPDIEYLEQIDPVLMLWDTHDLTEVKTHGLVFETLVGKGRLIVSALRCDSEYGAAGPWILKALCEHLVTGPAPKNGLSPACRLRLKEKLHEKSIPLVNRKWYFKPDPEDSGIKKGWHKAGFILDDTWKEIGIDRAWEGQGYSTLDNWGWYRISVDIPDDWKDHNIYLSFEGVDDYYELYINGQLAGGGGNILRRETAFSERKSHSIITFVTPGQRCEIAVRVYDWYGAGGIFRPVTLGTVDITDGFELLK